MVTAYTVLNDRTPHVLFLIRSYDAVIIIICFVLSLLVKWAIVADRLFRLFFSLSSISSLIFEVTNKNRKTN